MVSIGAQGYEKAQQSCKVRLKLNERIASMAAIPDRLIKEGVEIAEKAAGKSPSDAGLWIAQALFDAEERARPSYPRELIRGEILGWQ